MNTSNLTATEKASAHPLTITPDSNLGRRHRLGKVWRAIFLGSTLVSILALVTLLLNILNDSMGYVAYKYEIDPASLSTDGLALEELKKEELVAILRQNISTNAYNTLEKAKPFAERSQADVYELVYERVVEPEVVKSWTLFESLFRQSTTSSLATKKATILLPWMGSFGSTPTTSWPATSPTLSMVSNGTRLGTSTMSYLGLSSPSIGSFQHHMPR